MTSQPGEHGPGDGGVPLDDGGAAAETGGGGVVPQSDGDHVDKKVSVADFMSLPDSSVNLRRISEAITLKGGDELKVVLESYPPRPFEWVFLDWPSTNLVYLESDQYTTGDAPGTQVQTDEYRFRAVFPANSSFQIKQQLRFMYLSVIAPLSDVWLYEIEVTITS